MEVGEGNLLDQEFEELESLQLIKTTANEKNEQAYKNILERLHIHSKDDGGVFCLITGSQGSAKTSAMLSVAKYNMLYHADEPVFFSGCYDSPLQFIKLGPKKWHIFVKEGSNVIFRDRDRDLKIFTPPHQTYFKVTENDGEKDYSDVWNKAKKGKCNAVFFGDRFEWIDFITWLREKGWCHVFLDEISEICPANTSGDLWRKIREFNLILKDTRKCFTDIYCNTQSCGDIDYRTWAKIMVWFFLPGSKKSKQSSVLQGAINSLKKSKEFGNEGYIEFSGEWTHTRFTDFFAPIDGYHWDAHVLKETNDKKSN